MAPSTANDDNMTNSNEIEMTLKPMEVSSSTKKRSVVLNAAYESVETMRRLNLELQCQERGIEITSEEDYNKCTTCLLNPEEEKAGGYLPSFTITGASKTKKKKATPCLVCATPCCTTHRSKSFWQESLVVCCDCESVFTLEFAVDVLSNEKNLQPAVERLVDLYDRTLLLLQYSSPFVPEICNKLLQEEKRQNLTSFGTSTVGVTCGIVGAAAFVTPVGPPLLLGSLLFGTSATAVQVGSDARYFALPAQQLANRILALYGMLESVLRIRNTLQAVVEAAASPGRETDPSSTSTKNNKVLPPPKQKEEDTFFGKTAGRLLKTGVGRIVVSSTLSAAFLVWDTKILNQTVSAIRQGNRSDKAERLEEIRDELATVPKTNELDEEFRGFVEVLAEKSTRTLDHEEVVQIVLDEGRDESSAVASRENQPGQANTEA